MAPSHCIELTPGEQAQLLAIARKSIQHGLATQHPLEIKPSRQSGPLMEKHGNFVTLTQRGVLRGCIGSIEATRRLAQSVAVNAFGAAFRDRRFAALATAETAQTRIEISVLSRPEAIAAKTRRELLANLCPGEDGLLLEHDGRHTTFLPKVWDKVASPQQFVAQLMAKAGLSGDYWSAAIQFYRYHTLSFAEAPQEPVTPARATMK